MCESFSHDSPMLVPMFFLLENIFLHIFLVGEEGNVAYTSDNVTRNICTCEFKKFKMEDGSNRSSKLCTLANTIFTHFTACHLKLTHIGIPGNII